MPRLTIYLIGGSNGAGKTTFATEFLRKREDTCAESSCSEVHGTRVRWRAPLSIEENPNIKIGGRNYEVRSASQARVEQGKVAPSINFISAATFDWLPSGSREAASPSRRDRIEFYSV